MNREQTIPASIEHLDFEHSVQCESGRCEKMGRGAHEADWFVKLECGDSILWCNFRFMLYTQEAQRSTMVACQFCHAFTDVVSWHSVRVS